MDITITTSAKNNKEAYALLQAFNFPFREKEVSLRTMAMAKKSVRNRNAKRIKLVNKFRDKRDN